MPSSNPLPARSVETQNEKRRHERKVNLKRIGLRENSPMLSTVLQTIMCRVESDANGTDSSFEYLSPKMHMTHPCLALSDILIHANHQH